MTYTKTLSHNETLTARNVTRKNGSIVFNQCLISTELMRAKEIDLIPFDVAAQVTLQMESHCHWHDRFESLKLRALAIKWLEIELALANQHNNNVQLNGGGIIVERSHSLGVSEDTEQMLNDSNESYI